MMDVDSQSRIQSRACIVFPKLWRSERSSWAIRIRIQNSRNRILYFCWFRILKDVNSMLNFQTYNQVYTSKYPQDSFRKIYKDITRFTKCMRICSFLNIWNFHRIAWYRERIIFRINTESIRYKACRYASKFNSLSSMWEIAWALIIMSLHWRMLQVTTSLEIVAILCFLIW
jgi:hypothetical protein